MLTNKGRDGLRAVRADSEPTIRDDGVRDLVAQYVTAHNMREAVALALIGLVSHVAQAQGPEFEAAIGHTVHNIEDIARLSHTQAALLVRRALGGLLRARVDAYFDSLREAA